MPRTGLPPDEERTGSLDERVLRWISRSSGRIAFNALRRGLGVHPESLTRALRRLERSGAVTRQELGYALVAGMDAALGRPPERKFHSVASVELTEGGNPEPILGTLAGRWFGGLRWVGVYERDAEPWLVWSVEGARGEVLLSVHDRTLRVGYEPDAGTPDAVLQSAARDLLVQALTRVPRYEPTPPDGNVQLRARAEDPMLSGIAS